MATRFYFTDGITPDITPRFDGPVGSPQNWTVTDQATRQTLSLDKQGTSFVTASENVTVAAGSEYVLLRQYISPPLAAMTLDNSDAGFFCYIRAMENNDPSNIKSMIIVRVVSEDGLTYRGDEFLGYILFDHIGTQEFVLNTLTNIPFAAAYGQVMDMEVEEGDRLVVEVGFKISATGTGSFELGDDAATDLPENNTSTSQYNPWIEFSYGFSLVSTSSANTYFLAEEAKTVSEPIFIITLDGSYEVPQSDIIEAGQINMSKPVNFTDLIAGDHTMRLNNNDGKYSPGRSNFIWYGTTWYRKSIRIELGYKRPGTVDIIDKIFLYEGLITEWHVIETKDISADAPSGGLMVEITSQDHISLMAERQIGMPDADGFPQPAVYGRIFRDLQEIGTTRLDWSPDKTANFDGGNLNEVTHSTEGGGTLSATNTKSVTPSYSAVAEIFTQGDAANMTLDGASSYDSCMCDAMVYVDTLPTNINNEQVYFMALKNSGGAAFLYLYAHQGGDVYVTDTWTNDTTKAGWNLYESQGVWTKVSIIYRKAPTGLYGAIRIFVNDSEVWARVNNFNNNFKYFYCGLYSWTGYDPPLEAPTFKFYFDKMQMDYWGGPYGYYMPGFPYDSINTVYCDGAVLPEQKADWAINLPFINNQRIKYKNTPNARFFPYDNYTPYPNSGTIDILQVQNLPSGTFFGDYTKDDNDHPVDQIEDLLTLADLDSYIDATNFAACKTAMPNDILGCYFSESTVGEAISEITGLVLYDLVERQGKICLLPYTGSHLVSSVLTLNRTNCFSFEQFTDMSDIKTVITCKWGWYQREPVNYYRTEDAGLLASYGEQTQELDFSFGADVSTRDEATAQSKADLLKKRLCGVTDSIKILGDLSLARVELGDGVTVQNTNINSTDKIYEVVNKSVNLEEKTIELLVNRYSGEG